MPYIESDAVGVVVPGDAGDHEFGLAASKNLERELPTQQQCVNMYTGHQWQEKGRFSINIFYN
jgi:hypothetical protein